MGPGGFRRLQNDCDLTSSGRVGSIPTRSRQPVVSAGHRAELSRTSPGIVARIAVVLVVVALVRPVHVTAQVPDSTRAPRPDPTAASRARKAAPLRPVRDSLQPPIPPGRAFLSSFALPGMGQARLRRYGAGAIYAAVEAMSVALAAKSANDLRIARAHAHDVIVNSYQTDPLTGAPLVDALGNYVIADTARNRYAGQRVKARRTQLEDWFAALVFNHLFSGADAFVSAQLWDLPAQVSFRGSPFGYGVGITIRP